MAILAGAGPHDMRHQEADLGRGEELARALARAFRELAQQIFVGAPEEIGLHIGKAQAIARIGERLDHEAQLRRVDVALAVSLGGEIDDIDHAGERGVLLDDGAHRLGQVLADVLGLGALALVVQRPLDGFAPADRAPSGLGRQIEAQQGMVALGDLERRVAVAVVLGEPRDLVVEHIRQPLQEEQRQQIVLELRRVLLAPDRAGRIPEHLLHGLGRRGRGCGCAPAARDAGCGLG